MSMTTKSLTHIKDSHNYQAIAVEKAKQSLATAGLRKNAEGNRLQYEKNAKHIKDLTTKMHALKLEIRNVKKKQINYYHQVLSAGIDTRQEGLVWIIKVIWYLGANVALNKLPRFLDEKAVEYLFKVAKLEVRFIELQKSLKDISERRKKARIRRLTIKKSNAWGGVIAGILQRALKGMNINDECTPSLRKLHEETKWATGKNYKNSQKKCAKAENDIDSEILNVENEMKRIQLEIKEAKKAEVYRISKEFATQSYGQKYSASMKKVMSALHFSKNNLCSG